MAKIKIKKKWKSILSVCLTVVLGIGAIFGVTRLIDKSQETHKSISPSYSVGGLSSDGKYVETDESIYTKTAFECQGLKITPDFDSQVSYQVFFYDMNEQFLESTSEMTEFYQGAPLLAKYARIEITPQEDDKVSWYEVLKYAKQLTVEVAKQQDFNIEEKLSGYENKAVQLGEGVYDTVGGTGFKAQSTGFYFFDEIDVNGGTSLVMKVKNETLTNSKTYTDGQVFKFPHLYDTSGEKAVFITSSYSVVEVVGDYTYISFNVSTLTSVIGFVDVNSVDILEIFVV